MTVLSSNLSVLIPQQLLAVRSPASTWPRSYCVFDCKTSGLNPDDLIVQIYHLTVVDGQVVDYACPLLDWTRKVSDRWLGKRLAEVPGQPISIDDLKEGGEDPREILRAYLSRLRWLAPDLPLVGHNIFGYDLPLFRRHCEDWLGVDDFNLLALPIYDVGLSQKMLDGNLTPWPAEPSGEFHRTWCTSTWPAFAGTWSTASTATRSMSACRRAIRGITCWLPRPSSRHMAGSSMNSRSLRKLRVELYFSIKELTCRPEPETRLHWARTSHHSGKTYG